MTTQIVSKHQCCPFFLLAISAGAMVLLIEIAYLKRLPLLATSQDFLQKISESKYESIYKDMVAKRLECPVRDFLAIVDETANVYDPDLLCDEFADQMDIICRIHLRQIGLEYLEKTACALQDVDKVPRIVYFVIFGRYDFLFVHYVAVMAAKRYVSPSAIYVIGDQHPVGSWWEQVLRDVHGVRFVYRKAPVNVSGTPIKFKIHTSDIVRLQMTYMNGGIYLDADMVVLRDLTPLLDYDITLGVIDKLTGMGNAFIMAKRGSPFIREWYEEYTHYNATHVYWNSLKVPLKMWLKNSSRVHVESDKLYRPNWFQAKQLFNGSTYHWQKSYACHVWSHGTPLPRLPEEIQTSNTTVAQIFRHVLYGDSRPRIGG